MRLFIHGLESGNQGTKSIFFRERYPDMIIPKFEGGLPERMHTLRDALRNQRRIILVGSSFGGLMATMFALENESALLRLILLAPAIHLLTTEETHGRTVSVPTWIYHGTADKVIPLQAVESVARQVFSSLTFHRVEDDHYLHKTFPLIDWDNHLRGATS